MDSRYSESVLDHFRQPRHAGRLPPEAPDVGSGEASAPESGERVRLQIRTEADVIVAARFKAFGCPATIACASFAADKLHERSLAEAGRLSAGEIVRELALEPGQATLATLTVEALQAALADLSAKRGA